MYNKLASITIAAMILIIATVGFGQSDVRTDVTSKAPFLSETRVCEDTPGFQNAPEKTFEVDGDRIPEIIKGLTNGNIRFEKTRVFSFDQQLDNPALAMAFEPRKARFSPESRTIIVVGDLNGSEVIQDVRIVDLGDDAFGVLTDVYLDGMKADTTIGRGTPFELPSDYEAKNGATEAAASGPTVSSWTGVNVSASGVSNGRVAMSCGATWNGGFAVNDTTGKFPITINGNGFGNSRGSVLIAGRAPTITSWSNTRIVIDPTLPWTSSPFCAVVKITTASGSVVNSGLDVVPTLVTRVYGQCTHFVAMTRKQNGLTPSPTAYGGYSSITSSYVPRKNDQYQWGGGAHTGIATNVTGPVSTSGGYKTWKITIGEQNPDCRNGIKSTVTEFQTRTVNGATSVTKYPKSWASGYAGATLYYR